MNDFLFSKVMSQDYPHSGLWVTWFSSLYFSLLNNTTTKALTRSFFKTTPDSRGTALSLGVDLLIAVPCYEKVKGLGSPILPWEG